MLIIRRLDLGTNMKNCINTERLIIMIRAKQGGRSLRDIASEIGDVSPSTLSRVLRHSVPDMITFLKICDWLGIAATNFIDCDFDVPPPAYEITVVDRVNVLLRASRAFDPAVVNALCVLLRALAQPSTGIAGASGAKIAVIHPPVVRPDFHAE